MSFKTFYTRGKAADGLKAFLKSDILEKVNDQELAVRLTPDYDVGCKRPTFSDDYLTTRVSLKRQNIYLRPGDLTPTVSRYEETKKPISNV